MDKSLGQLQPVTSHLLDFEVTWWGTCSRTYGEETKQRVYASRMGITLGIDDHGPFYDAHGISVLDLGGGPVSMLLKTINVSRRTVVDPATYPDWVISRYESEGVEYVQENAEDYDGDSYDECWIYNVLQHVVSPEQVIRTAQAHADRIRLFEWVNLPAHPGHPHALSAAQLSEWLGAEGHVEQLDTDGCVGTAFYGVFDA